MAVAALEGYDQVVRDGQVRGLVAGEIPPELAAAHKEYVAARNSGGSMAAMSAAAQRYAATLDTAAARARGAEAAKAGEAARRNQVRTQREAGERRATEEYAHTLLTPTQILGDQAATAANTINRAAELGEAAAAVDDGETADRAAALIAQNSAVVFRNMSALMDQAELGDPATQAEAQQHLDAVLAAAGDSVIPYLHERVSEIAQGRDVLPEEARLIMHYARDPAHARDQQVVQLRQALTDAAFIHFGMPSHVVRTVATGNQRVGHATTEKKDVRTAVEYNIPGRPAVRNIPFFVLEAYVSDLSRFTAVQGTLGPAQETIQRGVVNAANHNMREVAQRIPADVLPVLQGDLRNIYDRVMAGGAEDAPRRPIVSRPPLPQRMTGAIASGLEAIEAPLRSGGNPDAPKAVRTARALLRRVLGIREDGQARHWQ
jgi:hypothetical protein